ncbi:MAG: response regulator [Rhizobiales bacterium]|jgi:DNA-binding response OmpR family regulator|nr:response regulator [Hyphomicrobiales bacterium]
MFVPIVIEPVRNPIRNNTLPNPNVKLPLKEMRPDEATDRPLKILIVEDEPLLAMDLEAQLLQMGHTVTGMASDARSAFELADGTNLDLALVDLNLRDGLTGPQIASELSRGKDTLVVFVTGSPDQIPPDYAGAVGAITKPWSPEALEQVVSLVRTYGRDNTTPSETDLTLVRMAPSFQGGKPRAKGK